MSEIKLGFKCGGPCCAPIQMSPEPSMSYPTIHIEGEESLDLPKSGTAVIRFRVVSETEEMRGDKEHYRCDLEVMSIDKVKSESCCESDNPKSYAKETEDALDNLARRKRDSDTEED